MLVESVTGDMLDKLISRAEEKDEFVWLWWHRDTLKYLEIWISSFCLISKDILIVASTRMNENYTRFKLKHQSSPHCRVRVQHVVVKPP